MKTLASESLFSIKKTVEQMLFSMNIANFYEHNCKYLACNAVKIYNCKIHIQVLQILQIFN